MSDPALAHLDPPPDPRTSWNLPAFGELPVVTRLDEVVSRVVAPNPSPMTLDGTNTYVAGEPGSGEALVVDPGPEDPEHLGRVEEVLTARDAACVLVLVTHHHPDHAAAAAAWAGHFGCRIAAPTRPVAGDGGMVVADGDLLGAAGSRVTAIATRGHSSDHTAYRLEHGPVLTGDHILGRGTSVVAHPDGDLASYLDSLRRVLDLGPDALYPGHGPALEDDPSAVISYYLEHRAFRERQILTLLAERPHHNTELVRRIYTDVDEAVLPAAAASTRAALEKLAEEGQIRLEAGGTAGLPD
jgi:glyoxylase-like metal-dependent hydrolase (beta-lactamase superfamily II)